MWESVRGNADRYSAKISVYVYTVCFYKAVFSLGSTAQMKEVIRLVDA